MVKQMERNSEGDGYFMNVACDEILNDNGQVILHVSQPHQLLLLYNVRSVFIHPHCGWFYTRQSHAPIFPMLVTILPHVNPQEFFVSALGYSWPLVFFPFCRF